EEREPPLLDVEAVAVLLVDVLARALLALGVAELREEDLRDARLDADGSLGAVAHDLALAGRACQGRGQDVTFGPAGPSSERISAAPPAKPGRGSGRG